MGESEAPVRAVDPSDTVGDRDVVVGATDVAMGDSVPASSATVVGSIEAVVVGEVVRTVGAFDPSEVGGRDAVSVVGEMVVNAADDGEEDSNITPTVGEVVVAVGATRVGEVVVAVRATRVGEVVVAVGVTTVGEVVVSVRVSTAGDDVQVGHMGELEGASVGHDS